LPTLEISKLKRFIRTSTMRREAKPTFEDFPAGNLLVLLVLTNQSEFEEL